MADDAPFAENMKKYYSTVYSNILSDVDGHGVVSISSDSYGKISVFKIPSLIGHGKRDTSKPVNIVQGKDGPVYHIQQVGDLLVSTAGEKVKVWRMGDILDQRALNTSPVAELCGSNNSGVLRLSYSPVMETLFSTHEDGRVCGWDIGTAKQKMMFTAHKSSVYSISQRPETSCLATGSGDGSVAVWDARSVASPVQSMAIGKSSWISCLDIDSGGNWLVCGGNFKPSLYHITSLTKSATLSLGGTTYSAKFVEDRLITGGSSSSVYHWSLNGTRLLKVPCSSRSVLSLSVLSLPANSQQILSVSGDSPSVDIFTNYGYKAFSLETE